MPDNQCLTVWHLNRFRNVATLPEYISVYLHDEIPRLGCGWRRLFILSHDSEWTVLLCPASAKAAKISSSVLHDCKPRTLLPEIDYSILFLSNRLNEIAGKIINTFTTRGHPQETDDDLEFGLTEPGEDQNGDNDDLKVRRLLAKFI